MSKVTNVGLHLTESASAVSDTAGEGQIWVKSDAPSSLYYTDDAGTDFRTGGITLSAEMTTTSGATHDVTNIPTGIKRICVMLNGASLSGTDEFLVQLGTGGSATTSGYRTGLGMISGSTAFTQQATNGFTMFNDAAGLIQEAVMIINLESVASNTWCQMNACGAQSTTVSGWGFGSVSLSGVLNFVRLTASGSNTYDAGKATVTFE
tara:strand:- start:296 stop:916 length:621 start_codon:yes stop_codon:yes gene_type:complete